MLRCQSITVAGFTITSGWARSDQSMRRATQNTRSLVRGRARFEARRQTASCWRRAAFSRSVSLRYSVAGISASSNTPWVFRSS